MQYSVTVLPRTVNPPYDLSELIDWLGIQYIVRPLPTSVRGFYLKTDQNTYIIVNSRDKRVRQRWTTAHELGHHLYSFASSDMTTAWLTTEHDSDPIEKICDRYAAELLMPESAVRRVAADMRKHCRGRQDWVEAMAKQFDVSHTAMWRRLQEINLL